MSHCILYVDLSPLPPPDGATLRFGLQLFGAADALSDAQARLGALRTELDGIAGQMPEEPVDRAGFKPWSQVEAAYVQHLGEFLPWCWTSSTIQLQVGSAYLGVVPRVLHPANPTLHADSLVLARRGYLRALYNGSAGFTEPAMFQQSDRQPSGARFSQLVFSAQATRWPAPVPQEALRNVLVVEVPRAPFQLAADADPLAYVVAVLALDVAGRSYPIPATPPAIDPSGHTSWLQSSGLEQLTIYSAGLRCSDVLQPADNPDSFLHPARSLWLREALQNLPPPTVDEIRPGDAIGDHDWWSRLHEGVASAAEVPRLMVESLRRSPDSAELRADFALSVLALCGALRDVLEPGIACDVRKGGSEPAMFPFPRSPAMLDLMTVWRAQDKEIVTPLDLLAIARDASASEWLDFANPPATFSADDVGRLALVYCVLHRETFSPPLLWDWYNDFRLLSPTLSERLPAFKPGTATVAALQSQLESLSSSERLALVEELRVEAMRAPVRASALLNGWSQAVLLRGGDPPKLAAAKVSAAAFLQQMRRTVDVNAFFQKQDVNRLFAGTAALDAVRLATRAQPGEIKTDRFATKIAAASVEHFRQRLLPKTVLQPALGVDANAHFLALEEAAAALAEEAHQWIFRRNGVDATGQPSPLVMQLDTLNDDGDLQSGETDLNQWLNGYATFVRRGGTTPGTSLWGCGQVGAIEARMWPSSPLLRDASGAVLLALSPLPATSSDGVRQVLLQHDNRSLLPIHGQDMIDASTSRQLSEGWSGADGFVVVASDPGTLPGAAKLPFLAFGCDYEAVVLAQARSGVLPSELAGGSAADAPYMLDWRVDLEQLLAASSHRRGWPYRRRTPVSAPRVIATPAPAAPASRLPTAWSPSSVSRELNLAQTTWAASGDEQGEGLSVCVLVSAAGLPAIEGFPEMWTRMRFALMPPSCTQALYDRWVAFDHACASVHDKAAWAAWRERIHASEMLISGWQGQAFDVATRAAIQKAMANPRALLDDPAVSAFVVTWTPLRSDSVVVEQLLLPLGRPVGPLVPTAVDPNDDISILFDRGRAGPADWSLFVQTYDGPGPRPARFLKDDVNRVLTVLLWPGEIGDLTVASAVTTTELVARCDLQPRFTLGAHSVFASWRTRFEICTAHRLDEAGVFAHCGTVVEDNRDVSLRWNRHEVPSTDALVPALLAVDNVGEIQPRRQVWHSTGRPLPAFPSDCLWLDDMGPLSSLEDGSPDPTASGVLWDAVGFAERFASSAVFTEATQLGLGSVVQVLHEERAGSDALPRYVRYSVQANHRYADLYRGLVRQPVNQNHFATATACQIAVGDRSKDEWLRAYRPGADLPRVPQPAVRMVVPLTRALKPTAGATGADLLVVLDEELDTTSALVTRLEAAIEPVARDLIDQHGAEVHVTLLEHAPDPILSGFAQQGTLVGLSCIGPLGHTFDTDTREPHFAAVSYLVQTGGLLGAWEFAKLRFRRLLAPELMEGYYPVPTLGQRGVRIVMRPTTGALVLTGSQLDEHGQGHLTLQGLAQGLNDTVLDIEFLGASLQLNLHCEIAVARSTTHAWSLRPMLPLPPDMFLDTDWHSTEQFDSPLSDRLRRADFRVVVARVRAGKPEIQLPARWEVAGYVAVSTRAVAAAGDDPSPSWDRTWTRILTWQRDEPDDLAASCVTVRASVAAAHGAAQSVCRVSDYTNADWVQTLPDASALAIGGTPWVTRTGTAPLVLKLLPGGQFELGIYQGGRDAVLNWHREPVALSQEGQGLHHVLLVTRRVLTADGSPSEAYVGIFNRANTLGNRFVPVELYQRDASIPAESDLRGYVLLVQKSARTHTGAAVGFWNAVFPPASEDPRKTLDSRLRILAVGEPLDGATSTTGTP